MNKTFQYRRYPTKKQQTTLNEWLASCCEVYNAALQEGQHPGYARFRSLLRYNSLTFKQYQHYRGKRRRVGIVASL